MTDRRRRAPGKRRSAQVSPEDDRPRGYEPKRMRRLWQDIDQSRDKLGIGSATSTNGASWTWDAWLVWASDVVGDTGAQVGALPGQIRSVVEQLPGAGMCRTVGEGAFTVAQKLPVVGTALGAVLALVPDPFSDNDKSPRS